VTAYVRYNALDQGAVVHTSCTDGQHSALDHGAVVHTSCTMLLYASSTGMSDKWVSVIASPGAALQLLSWLIVCSKCRWCQAHGEENTNLPIWYRFVPCENEQTFSWLRFFCCQHEFSLLSLSKHKIALRLFHWICAFFKQHNQISELTRQAMRGC